MRYRKHEEDIDAIQFLIYNTKEVFKFIGTKGRVVYLDEFEMVSEDPSGVPAIILYTLKKNYIVKEGDYITFDGNDYNVMSKEEFRKNYYLL